MLVDTALQLCGVAAAVMVTASLCAVTGAVVLRACRRILASRVDIAVTESSSDESGTHLSLQCRACGNKHTLDLK